MKTVKRRLYLLLAVLLFYWAGGLGTLYYMGIIRLLGTDKPWYSELMTDALGYLAIELVFVVFTLAVVRWADMRLNRSTVAERLMKEANR